MNLKDIRHVQEARKLIVLQTGIQSSFYFLSYFYFLSFYFLSYFYLLSFLFRDMIHH